MEGGGETHDGQSVEQVAADQRPDANIIVAAQAGQNYCDQFRERSAVRHQLHTNHIGVDAEGGADHVGIDSQRSGNTRGTHHEQATGSH